MSSFHIIPLVYCPDLRCASFDVLVAPGVPLTTEDLNLVSLFESFPGLRKHRCDSTHARSFFDEARQTDIVHLLEHLSIELLVCARPEISRSDIRGETGIPKSREKQGTARAHRVRFYGVDSLEEMDALLRQGAALLGAILPVS